MNVYIWENVDELTQNYHSDGGLVVFADTLERALELANAEGCHIDPEEVPEVRQTTGEEAIYLFPDAGCC